MQKYLVVLGNKDTNYDGDGDQVAFSFDTQQEAEKFAKGEWREVVDEAESIDEDRIFIAVVQSRYVTNPSFVTV